MQDNKPIKKILSYAFQLFKKIPLTKDVKEVAKKFKVIST